MRLLSVEQLAAVAILFITEEAQIPVADVASSWTGTLKRHGSFMPCSGEPFSNA